MANEQNLRPPFGQRPREETVAAGRKGGIKSGESKRRKKSLKEAAEKIMQMEPPEKVVDSLRRAGFGDEETTYQMAMMLGQIQEAIKGNTRAANFIANIMGELNAPKEQKEPDRSFIEALESSAKEDWEEDV